MLQNARNNSTLRALSFIFATTVSQVALAESAMTPESIDQNQDQQTEQRSIRLANLVEDAKAKLSDQDAQILAQAEALETRAGTLHRQWLMENQGKPTPERDFPGLLQVRNAYQAGLDMIADNFGPNSIFLPHHMVPLCAVYVEFDDYPEALDCYHHLQHIIKMNEGVWGYSQASMDVNGYDFNLLEQIRIVHTWMGDRDAAKALVDQGFRVNQAEFGRTVPVVTEYARTLMENGDVRRARRTYEDALELADEQGLDQIHIVPILEDLAFIHRMMAELGSSHERLEQARDIVVNHPDTDSVDHAVAQRNVADLLVLRGKKRNARRAYATAAEFNAIVLDAEPSLLGQVSVKSEADLYERTITRNGGQLITFDDQGSRRTGGMINFGPERVPTPLALGTPISICPATAMDYVGTTRFDLETLQGYSMFVRLTISESGHVSDVEFPDIEDQEVNRKFMRYFERELKSQRWRPAVRGGVAVEGVVEFEQNFDPHFEGSTTMDFVDRDQTETLSSFGCSYAKSNYNLN